MADEREKEVVVIGVEESGGERVADSTNQSDLNGALSYNGDAITAHFHCNGGGDGDAGLGFDGTESVDSSLSHSSELLDVCQLTDIDSNEIFEYDEENVTMRQLHPQIYVHHCHRAVAVETTYNGVLPTSTCPEEDHLIAKEMEPKDEDPIHLSSPPPDPSCANTKCDDAKVIGDSNGKHLKVGYENSTAGDHGSRDKGLSGLLRVKWRRNLKDRLGRRTTPGGDGSCDRPSDLADRHGWSSTASVCSQSNAATIARTQKRPFNLNRYILLMIYSIYTFATARVLFGWPNLSNMLFRSGSYIWTCTKEEIERGHVVGPDGSPKRYYCDEQDSAVQFLYSFGIACSFTFSLLAGSLTDWRGPRFCACIGQLLSLTGWILLGFANESRRTYIPGIFFIALGADAGFLPAINICNLFPGHEGFVVMLISAAMSASFSIPTILDTAWQNNSSLDMPFLCFMYAGFGPAVFFLVALAFFPDKSYKSMVEIAEEYGLNSKNSGGIVVDGPEKGEITGTHEQKIGNPVEEDKGVKPKDLAVASDLSSMVSDSCRKTAENTSSERIRVYSEDDVRGNTKVAGDHGGNKALNSSGGDAVTIVTADGEERPVMDHQNLLHSNESHSSPHVVCHSAEEDWAELAGLPISRRRSSIQSSRRNSCGEEQCRRGENVSSRPENHDIVKMHNAVRDVEHEMGEECELYPRSSTQDDWVKPAKLTMKQKIQRFLRVQRDSSFMKQLKTFHFLGIFVYWPLNAIFYNFYITSAENILGRDVNDLLGILGPLSMVPSLLLGNVSSAFGVMVLLAIINVNGVLMYVCAMIPGVPAKYVSAVFNMIYLSSFSGQMYCYISDTFETGTFGRFVGIVSAVGGLLSFLRGPLVDLTQTSFDGQYVYTCVIMLALTLICSVIVVLLYFLKKRQPKAFLPPVRKSTDGAGKEQLSNYNDLNSVASQTLTQVVCNDVNVSTPSSS